MKRRAVRGISLTTCIEKSREIFLPQLLTMWKIGQRILFGVPTVEYWHRQSPTGFTKEEFFLQEFLEKSKNNDSECRSEKIKSSHARIETSHCRGGGTCEMDQFSMQNNKYAR